MQFIAFRWWFFENIISFVAISHLLYMIFREFPEIGGCLVILKWFSKLIAVVTGWILCILIFISWSPSVLLLLITENLLKFFWVTVFLAHVDRRLLFCFIFLYRRGDIWLRWYLGIVFKLILVVAGDGLFLSVGDWSLIFILIIGELAIRDLNGLCAQSSRVKVPIWHVTIVVL